MKYNSINNIRKVLFLFIASAFIWSCNDDIEYVPQFDNININMGDIKDIYYYNETLVLDPAISLGNDSLGTTETSYTYTWSFINTDEGTVQKIADAKQLELTLDTIGVLNLYFQIEDNDTHNVNSTTSIINVESVTNQGWYVLKQTIDGNTDIDGYYLSSDEPDYNILTQKLGSTLLGAPKGFAFSNYFKYKPYPDSSFYYTTASLMVFSEKDALAYNVSNAQPIIQLKDMFFLNPENADQSIKTAMLSSSKVFVSMENGAYTMNDGNPAFFPVIEGDYSIDNCITTGSYGNTLAFDNKNKSYIMFGSAGYSTSDTIGYFKDEYSQFNNGLEISVNNMNGEAIFMENTQRGSGYSSTTYAYSLFKEDGNNDDLILYGLDYDALVEGYYYYYPTPGDYSNYIFVRAGNYSPINFMRRLSKVDYPMLTSADSYAMNKNNNILYFAKGNQIGIYNIDNQNMDENFITDIPSDEQITFMKYINTSYAYNDEVFTGLVVATYNEGTDIYNIYNYQLSGLSSYSRNEYVKTGQGRVEKVIYISPSSYSWSSNLYQYN